MVTKAQFSFTSGEHDVYTTMARPEVAHRFCGRTATFDRDTLEPLNSADRHEAAEREESIAAMAAELASTACYRSLPREPLSQRKQQILRRPVRQPIHVLLNDRSLDTDDPDELGSLANWLEMCAPPTGDCLIDRKIDRLEDRVEERRVVLDHRDDDCLGSQPRNNKGGGRHVKPDGSVEQKIGVKSSPNSRTRSLHAEAYKGQTRLHIRVDGHTFTL